MPTWLWVIIGIVDVIIGVAITDYAWGGEWEQPHLHTCTKSTPATPKAPPPPKKSEKGARE